MKASFHRYILNFKRPSGTSRGIMTQKETWFIVIESEGKTGIGECGILRGLSFDDRPDFEAKLIWLCENIQLDPEDLHKALEDFPAIQFGLEQAFYSLSSSHPFLLFPSDFTNENYPIPINGLVWMGEREFMRKQIQEKLKSGFTCIKMKIGAIDFQTELDLLRFIRNQFSKEAIEIRVDANGAFHPEEALTKLEQLATLDIHSIEQPIRQGQWDAMRKLCKNTPIPIALDEELIGVVDVTKREELLQTIKPQYIILKPSLVGGYKESEHWINLAQNQETGWWVTSALESNIGLNAIAQWTFTLKNELPQGLGTGGLFTKNFEAPLEVSKGRLYYRKELSWQKHLITSICT